MRVLKAVFFYLALMIVFSHPALAKDACSLHNWLRVLLTESEHFLEELQTAAHTPAVKRLEFLLHKRSPVEVKLRLAHHDMHSLQSPAHEFLIAHRILLRMAPIAPVERVQKTAIDLKARQKAETLGKLLTARPCNALTVTGNERGPAGKQSRTFSIDSIHWGLLIALLLLGILTVRFVFALMQKKERRAHRFICDIPCIVIWGNTHIRAQMVDISQLGAKIETSRPIVLDGTVQVVFGNRARKAQVVWNNSVFIGLLFQTRLSHNAIIELTNHDPQDIHVA